MTIMETVSAGPTGLVARRPGTGLKELLDQNPALRIERDDYNINVTANYGSSLDPAQVENEYAAHQGRHEPTHLYFHVPLCAYICNFCNYVKRKLTDGPRREETLSQWTSLLVEESRRYLDRFPWLSEARVESMYLGGGTASLLGTENLGLILQHARERYLLSPDCEISLEGNPDNFLQDEVAEAVDQGFNRFSVGVQSLQSEVNQYAGRGHDREMSLRAIERIRRSGMPFNVDMMFGLPHQTVRTVADDIRQLVDLEVPTITIYRLRNADRAKMGIGNRALWNVESVLRRMEGEGVFPTLEETYDMREAVVGILLDSGYRPSPCGWWNRPGTYRDGNIPQVSRNKWERHNSMVAFGPGAYGWLTGGSSTVLQTHNIADIAGYAKFLQNQPGLPLASGRKLAGYQAVGMALGFAYKACQPIAADRFRAQFGVELFRDEPFAPVFAELLERGLIEPVPGRPETVLPTLDGEALHEEIISVYFHQRIGDFSEEVCRR